ncbi:MAG: hypothetical protein K6A44_04270 [bacterium]|nr:hypothetical protein [bacterium]
MKITAISNNTNFARNKHLKSIFPEVKSYSESVKRMTDSPVFDDIGVLTSDEAAFRRGIEDFHTETTLRDNIERSIRNLERFDIPEPKERRNIKGYSQAMYLARLIKHLEEELLFNPADRANIEEQIESLKYAMPSNYMKIFNIKL